jgi:hypothetical protein
VLKFGVLFNEMFGDECFSLVLTMPTLSSAYIILSALLNNVLYINHPPNAGAVYICFDEDGVRNDSWPDDWTRMSPHVSFNVLMLTTSVPDSATEYKLRMVFQDHSTGDSSWLKIKPLCPVGGGGGGGGVDEVDEPYKCSMTEQLDVSQVSGLLYYITLCTTICVTKIISKILRKKIWAAT